MISQSKRKTLITLINPPTLVPDMPLTAFPILKGSLESSGISARVMDLNVEYFHHMLSKNAIHDAVLANDIPEGYVSEDSFIEAVDVASKNLRTVLPFEELARYDSSRKIVDTALDFVAKKYDARLGLMTSSLHYSNGDSSQVLTALSDNARNPYIDFFKGYLENIVQSEVVGIGILIPEQIIPTFTLCSLIKEYSPETKIIIGGNTFTRVKEDIDKSSLSKLFDYGINSEADFVLPKLVKSISAKENITLEKIAEWEKIVPELKTLPKSDWSDIDFSRYFVPESVATIMGGRGCYCDDCSFCAIPRAYKNEGKFRSKTSEQVFEEIKELYHGRGVKHFKFVEESHSAGFAKQLSELIINSELYSQENQKSMISMEAFTNLEPAFGLNAKLFAKAGYTKLMYGLETINPETEASTNKRSVALASQRDFIFKANDDAGIVAFTFLIAGIPGENEEASMKTAEYVIKQNAIRNFVVSAYSLDRLAPDADSDSNLQKSGLVYDISRAGDISCYHKFRIRGIDDDPIIHGSRIAKDMFRKIHNSRPDLEVMASFLPAARQVYMKTYGHNFAERYVLEHGRLSVGSSADRYLIGGLVRKTREISEIERENIVDKK